MSETNNDKTQMPNFQGGAYDFQNKNQQKQDADKEAFGNDGKGKAVQANPIGDDKEDQERAKDYNQHRNQQPQTHDYARSMDRGRDIDADEKRNPDEPRNQQVPYAPHDSSGESKESPSARDQEKKVESVEDSRDQG